MLCIFTSSYILGNCLFMFQLFNLMVKLLFLLLVNLMLQEYKFFYFIIFCLLSITSINNCFNVCLFICIHASPVFCVSVSNLIFSDLKVCYLKFFLNLVMILLSFLRLLRFHSFLYSVIWICEVFCLFWVHILTNLLKNFFWYMENVFTE